MDIFILIGPHAIGKTRNSAALAKFLDVRNIVDDWNGTDDLTTHSLAITNNPNYAMPYGAIALHVEDEEGINTLLATLEKLLFAKPDTHECACGKPECNGKFYRPPYSRELFECPLRASAHSSENTASTAL